MHSSRVALPILALCATALVLVAPVVRAGTPGPPSATPTYGHSGVELEHFVADELPKLVEGRTFDWKGHHYEIVALRSIQRTDVTRWEPAHAAAEAPHRGWTIGVIRLRVDGRLMRARIEGTARYVTYPGGWEWDRVLLFLGSNQSYDFVKGRAL